MQSELITAEAQIEHVYVTELEKIENMDTNNDENRNFGKNTKKRAYQAERK